MQQAFGAATLRAPPHSALSAAYQGGTPADGRENEYLACSIYPRLTVRVPVPTLAIVPAILASSYVAQYWYW